jgi:GT2 family glycosyltransferase
MAPAGDNDPLTRLSAELDELRRAVQLLARESEPPPGDAAASSAWVPRRSPVMQAVEAKLISARAAMRLVQTQITALEAKLDRADRDGARHRVKHAEVAARLTDREQLLKRIQESSVWRAVKPLWKLLGRERQPQQRTAPAADLEFGLDAPNEWKTAAEVVLIRGWCFSRSGREIAGVRAKIGKRGRLGRYGLERLDLPLTHAHASSRVGFTIETPVPVGTSTVRLEAIVQGGDWEPFFEHAIVREGVLDGSATSARDDDTRGVIHKQLPHLPGVNARKAFDLLAPLFRHHAERAGARAPFFSIITPTFNTRPQWLAEAALSILHQSFVDWEWCIVDDGSDARETKRLLEQLSTVSPRLRIQFIANSGISAATNRALEAAAGEYVCFLDHDDLLDPEALELMEKKLVDGFDAAYSDEDKLDDSSRQLVEPFFKPDWSPDYFRGVMYVGHLLCVRRELAQRVRFEPSFDGVQDFEFVLRLSEIDVRIGHIPRVLYHWRKTPGSIAERSDAKPEAGRLQERAVNEHLQRIGLATRAEAKASHRLRIIPAQRETYPRVSIIIPTKDAPEFIERCLDSIYAATSYPDFEVIVIDNETTDAAALRAIAAHPVTRVELPGQFNFSRANNLGVARATGSFVVFLNNDTEVLAPDWLHHLLYYAEQRDVGAAGALLVYPDRTVQHAGVALGMRGTADHTMRGFPVDADGYAGSLGCAREVSAVTAACMMIRKALFLEIGGFNEHFFTAYQDLELCLRLRDRGLRIIYTPESVVVHHESASRKKYYDMVDRTLLLDLWEPVIERGDPYYNPNLNLERGDYTVAAKP